MRRLWRYKHVKPPPDLLVRTCDAFSQLVASRQHEPTALDTEVFCFVDFIGGGGGSRPAFPRTFVAIRDLR